MKPTYGHLAGALALTFTISACIPSPSSTPPPEPQNEAVQQAQPEVQPEPVVVEPAQATQPAAQANENWLDAPRSPGNWSYASVDGGTIARYGTGGTSVFSIGCMVTSRRVIFSREGIRAPANSLMTIRTETTDRSLTTRTGSANSTSAAVAASDPLLDAIALTRGRFAVELPGTSPLYLPAWAEVTRVIEDCR